MSGWEGSGVWLFSGKGAPPPCAAYRAEAHQGPGKPERYAVARRSASLNMFTRRMFVTSEVQFTKYRTTPSGSVIAESSCSAPQHMHMCT